MATQMTAQDRKWQAENDARTLMDAEQIRTDNSRLEAAKPQVKKLASERQKEARAATKAAAKLTKTKPRATKPRAQTSKRKRKR